MNKYSELVALQVIHVARTHGYLTGQINALEALSDTEHDLFVAILRQLRLHLSREKRLELTGEELLSLYTFILAKAAEAVSSTLGSKPFEMELLGMLDGKIPFYTDPKLEEFCHTTSLPVDFATGFKEFYRHYGEGLERDGVEPVLVLAEALKWTWRVAVHVCYSMLTGQKA
ncbi:MAG: hypothetical protein PHI85_10425 [Victivallaceae bacterium]|nr:hypothetical protein [Victivallaceae bacterium]